MHEKKSNEIFITWRDTSDPGPSQICALDFEPANAENLLLYAEYY